MTKRFTSFFHPPGLFFLGALCIASLVGINQYQFGMWNQFIALPWLFDFLQPELYPSDLLVDQRVHSPSVFIPLQAQVLPWLGNDLPLLYLILYVLALLGTFGALARIADALHASPQAQAFTLTICAFSFPTIGHVHLFDSLLMERTLGLPFLLFSLSAMLRGRLWWAAFLQGLAFNLHPLSAIYLLIASWTGMLAWRGWRWSFLGQALVFVLVALPTLYLKFRLAPEAGSTELHALWLEVMRLRNGEHAFPSVFPWRDFLHSGLVLLVFALLLTRSGFEPGLKRFFWAFAGAIVLLLVLGTLFSELWPVKLILQLQFFRSFRFLIYLCLILFALLSMDKPRPIHGLLLVLLLPLFFYGALAKSLGQVMAIALAYFALRGWSWSWRSAIVLSIIFLALGGGALILRGSFDFRRGGQSADWYALQEEVQRQTPPDALIILPPQEKGFRVYSRRAVFGEWYDGTKAFFSEQYAAYWYNRMSALGCLNPSELVSDYQAIPLDHFQSLAEQFQGDYSAVYLVQYAQVSLPLAPAYRNSDFALYRLR